MSSRSGIEPVAWLLWLMAVSAVPLVSRQPLYLALTLLVVIVVHLSTPSAGDRASPWRFFASVGTSVAVLSIGFNVLTVHSGDRVFGELPSGWPIIGGNLTYNALLYGVASALAISALLFAAATFNTVVRHIELIRRIPRSLQHFGIAGAIALNYIPQTIQAGRDIYDAQRARGHHMRSIRSVRSFVVPLLGNGLERAVQMSEALETRGYGHHATDTARQPLRRWRTVVGIALIAGALPLLATGRLFEALMLATASAVTIAASRPQVDRRIPFSDWNGASRLIAGCASITLIILGLVIVKSDALTYSPFPRLVWPGFNALIALVLTLQLLPALIVQRSPE